MCLSAHVLPCLLDLVSPPLQLAITQTAYIPECGGEFKDSNECGNFLEVHRPGSIEVLTSVRIKGQYTSGYSGIVISSNYKRDPKRILCKGDYEVSIKNEVTTFSTFQKTSVDNKRHRCGGCTRQEVNSLLSNKSASG